MGDDFTGLTASASEQTLGKSQSVFQMVSALALTARGPKFKSQCQRIFATSFLEAL